jgi:hypothetical protein
MAPKERARLGRLRKRVLDCTYAVLERIGSFSVLVLRIHVIISLLEIRPIVLKKKGNC